MNKSEQTKIQDVIDLIKKIPEGPKGGTTDTIVSLAVAELSILKNGVIL